MLNVLTIENVQFIYIKKMSSNVRQVTRFLSHCKRIDFGHKISIILVSITRPNSTENITCSSPYDCAKQTIFT